MISFLTFASVAGSAAAAPPIRCETFDGRADLSASAEGFGETRRSFNEGGKVGPYESDRAALRTVGADLQVGPSGTSALRTVTVGADLQVGPSTFDEMLRGEHTTPLHWDRVPELVVLTSVMQYEKGRGTGYRATSQPLSDEEVTQLVSDLTDALVMLTDNTFQAFASVRREAVAAGAVVNVMRPGQIVIARYAGVRDQLATIGFGGRSTRGSTIRAGSIILDNDFDRAQDTRGLLRMHELGHALGYNHVLSRPSIMNPKIGPAITNVDRAIARVAFQGFPATASSCS